MNQEKIGKFISSLRKEKNSHIPLFYAGLQVYLQQHCLYFLPLPHGTDGEWSFYQQMLLILFIYWLFLTSRFLIFPLDFSVY